MSFFTSKRSTREFEKVEFLRLTPGQHTIRILEPESFTYNQHWIGGGAVFCLEDDCPQCEFNKKILAEVSGDFKRAKDIQGFTWKQERGAVNVLDRTMTKVCPKCNAENTPIGMTTNFAAACGECGQMLANVVPAPSNKVKLFSRAGSVFQAIADQKILDPEGNVLSPTEYDIVLHVQGNATVPIPTSNFEKIDPAEFTLLDSRRVAINLSKEEMIKRMSGVSLKDIFAARKAGVGIDDVEISDDITPEKRAELLASVEDYFNQLSSN